VRGEACADTLEQLAAEDLGFDGQAAPLVIVEYDTALAELLLEDFVFGAEVVDHVLLLAIHPAGKDGEQEMPRVKNEILRNHDRPRAAGKKVLTSAGNARLARGPIPSLGRNLQVELQLELAARCSILTIRASPYRSTL